MQSAKTLTLATPQTGRIPRRPMLRRHQPCPAQPRASYPQRIPAMPPIDVIQHHHLPRQALTLALP